MLMIFKGGGPIQSFCQIRLRENTLKQAITYSEIHAVQYIKSRNMFENCTM